MYYVLLYVYVLVVESTLISNRRECFLNNRFYYKHKFGIYSTDSSKARVDLIESPSKQIYNRKFFNLIDNNTEKGDDITHEDKIKWASFEVRRFTYKLGRYNKKLRKVKESRKLIYSSFNVDENELKKLNLKSRNLTSFIETYRRYRKLFLKYLKGLKLKNSPVVPYVPPELRSQKISVKYYLLSPEPVNKRKTIRSSRINKNKLKKDTEDTEKLKSLKNKNDFKRFMSLLAEVKGRRYYKGKIY